MTVVRNGNGKGTSNKMNDERCLNRTDRAGKILSERFVGTWKLASFERKSDDQITYIFGKDPSGYLIYSSQGYMSVAFMASKRRRFFSTDFMKATTEVRSNPATSPLAK